MTTECLESIAYGENLEYWWYPLWLEKLSDYKTGNYANQNYFIGPQASLRDSSNPGTYYFPDFVVFNAQHNPPNNATKTLRLVMEVKRDCDNGSWLQARMDTLLYLILATDPSNSPYDSVFGVATAGPMWCWRQITRQVGGIWNYDDWSDDDWSGALTTEDGFAQAIAL